MLTAALPTAIATTPTFKVNNITNKSNTFLITSNLKTISGLPTAYNVCIFKVEIGQVA